MVILPVSFCPKKYRNSYHAPLKKTFFVSNNRMIRIKPWTFSWGVTATAGVDFALAWVAPNLVRADGFFNKLGPWGPLPKAKAILWVAISGFDKIICFLLLNFLGLHRKLPVTFVCFLLWIKSFKIENKTDWRRSFFLFLLRFNLKSRDGELNN